MIRLIVWVVIGLLALSFFGISLRALVDNPTNQDNWQFLLALLRDGWDYIAAWFEATFGFIFSWFN